MPEALHPQSKMLRSRYFGLKGFVLVVSRGRKQEKALGLNFVEFGMQCLVLEVEASGSNFGPGICGQSAPNFEQAAFAK